MRSLNGSLPPAYSSRPVPPEQLLQAFKTAALSVTNLYKAAVTDQNNSRAAGYQDALDDILRFLDSENLGLQDGEGWRVRQWATERYDHSANHPSSDTEEAKSEPVEGSRAAHIEEQENAARERQAVETTVEPEQSIQDRPRHDSAPPVFRFTAGQSDQSDAMQVSEEPVASSSQTEAPPIQVQVINRANRASHRHNGRHARPNRTTSSVAGAKRKLQQVPDFFDISNIFRDDKDSGPSGKRSRVD